MQYPSVSRVLVTETAKRLDAMIRRLGFRTVKRRRFERVENDECQSGVQYQLDDTGSGCIAIEISVALRYAAIEQLDEQLEQVDGLPANEERAWHLSMQLRRLALPEGRQWMVGTPTDIDVRLASIEESLRDIALPAIQASCRLQAYAALVRAQAYTTWRPSYYAHRIMGLAIAGFRHDAANMLKAELTAVGRTRGTYEDAVREFGLRFTRWMASTDSNDRGSLPKE